MCQVKPGPRCSAHAKQTLGAARTRFDEASAVAEEVRGRWQVTTRQHSRWSGEYQSAVEEYRTSQDNMLAAERAYKAALRHYETTPEGQETLQTAIDRLTLDGNLIAAQEATQRLAVARALRESQVRDLAAAKAGQARLANPTPAEQAALDQAQAAVNEAIDAHAEALAAAESANIEYAQDAAAFDAATAEMNTAMRAKRQADEAVLTATTPVVAAAKRLYVQAGVTERMAKYYVEDMLDGAAPRESHNRGVPVPVVAPLRIKVKASQGHPDRDKTLAAKTAAETDPEFRAANHRLSEAIAAARNAEQGVTEIRRSSYAAAAEQHNALSRTAEHAQYRVEDALTKVQKASQSAAVLRAQIADGAGVSTVTLPVAKASDSVVRNPDGSTNAWVYRPPAEGFPDGRYLRVVGVQTAHGMSAANALVLEDGSPVVASEHYYRGSRGAQTDKREPNVLIVTPLPGARPLRDENLAHAGYSVFVDSTD